MADKMKRNQLILGNECNCLGTKLLRLGCELKFISPEHKYLAGILITILRMNRLRKSIVTRAEKISCWYYSFLNY